MKINLNRLICNLAIFFPAIYSFFMLFSDSFSRKLVIAFLLLIILDFVISKKRSIVIFLIGLVTLTFLNIIKYGVLYTIHQDYYSFVLLMSLFVFFLNKYNLKILEEELLKTQKMEFLIYSYFFVLIMSIIIGDGLRISSEWAVSLPMLYGPYSLPHSTAYQLIIIYAMASILYHRYLKRKYLIIMAVSVILLMWTGVRSAFLAIAIMVFLDYYALKNVKTKAIITMMASSIILYLALFTDFLVNNPVIKKTILAAGTKSGITNSRIDFIKYLSSIFITRLSLNEKILGVGIEKLRYFMFLRYGTDLQAHNDIFNSLFGMGIIGFCVYAVLFYRFCKKSLKWEYVFIILFTLLFFNGLYMYIAFTPSIGLFLIYSNYIYKTRKKNAK